MQKVLFLVGVMLVGCGAQSGEKAQLIIDKAIKAHGQTQLMNSEISFTFRKKVYSARREKSGYRYTRSFEDSTGTIRDVLINGFQFTRIKNGDTVTLSQEDEQKFSNSVNSVLYFVQLPYLLNDPAVIKTYEGTEEIGDLEYDIIKVSFRAENGGDDYDDEYRFWIEKEKSTLDYFAYSYNTDGGGVRFREAYNRSSEGDIIFQDYVNYEVAVGTPLKQIPTLFKDGKLKELSRIKNENIIVKRF